MDYVKLIKKEFRFLVDLGFKTKDLTRNFEIEINYIKNDLNIGINFVSYNNSIVGCGYEYGDKKENILKSSLFADDKLDVLKKTIQENINSAEDQIKHYAKFFKDNLKYLLKT